MTSTLVALYLFIGLGVAVWAAAARSSWFSRSLMNSSGLTSEFDLGIAFVVGLFWPVALAHWLLSSKRNEPTTSTLALVGKEGVVCKDLVPVGSMKIDGQEYLARARTGCLPLGTKVAVVAVDSEQLLVARTFNN